MKVHPELIIQSHNQIYSHLGILASSGRTLGLNNSPRSVLDWLVVIFMSLAFSWGSIYTFVQISELYWGNISTVQLIVESIQLLGGFFLVLVGIANSFNVSRSLKVILEDLNAMDTLLCSVVVRAAPGKYRLVTVIGQLSSYILFVIVVLLVHALAENTIIQRPELYYIIRFFPMFCIGSSAFLFANIVVEVKIRIKRLNVLVREHISHQRAIPIRQLHLYCGIYEKAFEVCRRLNFTYGAWNLCQVGYCFLSTTAKIFFIFITLTNLNEATISDLSELLLYNCENKIIL